MLSKLATKYLAPEAEGHGTEKVIEAIHKNNTKIDIKVTPVKFLATIISIATGGSAGKEAPAAQIGSSIMSFLSDIFKLDENERKKLVICGISAEFSSVFGTPIGGAIFGVEVLYVGNLLYEVLLPSFISRVTAHYVCSLFKIKYFNYPITCNYNFNLKLFFRTNRCWNYFWDSSKNVYRNLL